MESSAGRGVVIDRRDATTGLRRWWTAAFVAGEFVGFIPPAVIGATLAAAGVSDAVLVTGLTVAGMGEGAALGTAQAFVLRRYAPGVDRGAWVWATTIAAGVAWAAGMGGSVALGAAGSPWLLVVVAPVWMLGLLSMGWLQWRVLQRAHPRSGSWVWVTTGAWAVGVMIPVTALSAVPDDLPPAAHVVTAVVAAVAMGVFVGVTTGGWLRRILDRSPPGIAPTRVGRGGAPLSPASPRRAGVRR